MLFADATLGGHGIANATYRAHAQVGVPLEKLVQRIGSGNDWPG